MRLDGYKDKGKQASELYTPKKPNVSIEELTEVAGEILCALLSNPERYKYISDLVEEGKITQEEANMKNINKAWKIAESFYAKITQELNKQEGA